MAMERLRKRSKVLRLTARALERSLWCCRRPSFNEYLSEEDPEKDSGREVVPEDVKEGHFAVLAVRGEESRRFVVSLSCLSDPTFLRLLEKAAEEFGFRREGAITIPYRPSELERIIGEL